MAKTTARIPVRAFDTLSINDIFTFATAKGAQVSGIEYRKVSATSIVVDGIPDPAISPMLNGDTPCIYLRHFITPEERIATVRRSLERKLDDMISDGKDAVTEFTGWLEQNPVSAFESAQRTIERVAAMDVALRLQHVLTFDGEHGGMKAAYALALQEALRGAEYPSHSTSVVSNLVAEAKIAAYAVIARHGLDRLEN